MIVEVCNLGGCVHTGVGGSVSLERSVSILRHRYHSIACATGALWSGSCLRTSEVGMSEIRH